MLAVLRAAVLVGIVRAAPFLDMTEEDFDAVIAVNLKGVFLCCQVLNTEQRRARDNHSGVLCLQAHRPCQLHSASKTCGLHSDSNL
jgi:NAD(P)-dependent dehydrogenase (short-subunit alcohol dehydrogenase family)